MKRVQGYRQLLHLCLHILKMWFPRQDNCHFTFTRHSIYFSTYISTRENLSRWQRFHFHLPYVLPYDILLFLYTRVFLLCIVRHGFVEHVGGHCAEGAFCNQLSHFSIGSDKTVSAENCIKLMYGLFCRPMSNRQVIVIYIKQNKNLFPLISLSWTTFFFSRCSRYLMGRKMK